MKLYFLRHAERKHGKYQDILTKKGIEQTKEIVNFLKTLNIDKVICGTKKRTKKTIELFLIYFKGTIEFTSEVNEHELGKLQGKTAKEWREAVAKSGLSEDEFRPEGGENRQDAYKRAKEFLEKLKKENTKNILIVSHAGFISDITTLILKEPMENSLKYKTNHCSISIFDLDKGWNVIKYKVIQIEQIIKSENI